MCPTASSASVAARPEPTTRPLHPLLPRRRAWLLRFERRLRASALFFRYITGSLVSAAADYLVFILAYALLGNVTVCVYLARGFAVLVNYLLLRFAVYRDRASIMRTLPRYLAVVVVSGAATVVLIEALHRFTGLPVVLAKMAAELLLYGVNYMLINRRVFNHRRA